MGQRPKPIAGLTIIYQSTRPPTGLEDDPQYGPFKLVARLRGADYLSVGKPPDEVIILRAHTRRAIDAAIGRLNLREHCRLKSLVVTGPNGEIERIERTPRT